MIPRSYPDRMPALFLAMVLWFLPGLRASEFNPGDWLTIDHSGFSFMLPPTFVQTNIESDDSHIEEYVDSDREIAIRFDTLSGFPLGGMSEAYRIEVVSLINQDARRATLVAPIEPGGLHSTYLYPNGHRLFSMMGQARTRDGIELIHRVFESVRFPDTPVAGLARKTMTEPSREEDLPRMTAGALLRECRQALTFHRPPISRGSEIPKPLVPPNAEAAALAIRTLQHLEPLVHSLEIFPGKKRLQHVHLVLPFVTSDERELREAAVNYLFHAPVVPATWSTLANALDTEMPTDRILGSRIAAALVRCGEVRALPSLRRAHERGMSVAFALGALGEKQDLDLLLMHYVEGDREAHHGLRVMLERSNKPMEPWMYEMPEITIGRIPNADVWVRWWNENSPTLLLSPPTPRS